MKETDILHGTSFYLVLEKYLSDFYESTVIVDFYNIYCELINYKKHKTFTYLSYIKCLELICNKFKQVKKLYIIAKEVFESNGTDIIVDFTKKYKNLTYIIVNDTNKTSMNRERDDFYELLLYNKICKNNKTIIITKDKFKNYMSIIESIKKIDIIVLENNQIKHFFYCEKQMEESKNLLLKAKDNKINKMAFYINKISSN